MRKYLLIIGLESYALLLALYQGIGGVRTDEAKYLLNIPYPHPPVARFILHLTESFSYQELLWRMVFATLLVQAVWLVASLARKLSPEDRLTLCGMWLFSASVLFQSGTIMMAVLTAMQGMVFVWIFGNQEIRKSGNHDCGCVAMLWLLSLFTAYQAVLYLPVVAGIFLRRRQPLLRSVFAIGVPLLLVVLYIASNPLAAASFVSAGGQNTALPLETVVMQTVRSLLWSGSIVFSVIGVAALACGRQWWLLGSFALIVLFLLTSFRDYYAVLFLPVLAGAVAAYPRVLRHSAFLLALQIVSAVFIFAHSALAFTESPARIVMRQVNQLPAEGVVLISGVFGHQWQYESTSPVLRYNPSLLAQAKAIVCLDACPEVSRYGFYQIGNVSKEVWIRK